MLKKKISVIIATAMIATSLAITACADGGNYYKNGIFETTVEESSSENIDERSVSLSQDFTAYVGQSWSTHFTMDRIVGENHNAFKVVVTNVKGGTYKVIITSDHGYEYTSSECSGGVTLTTTNANAGERYHVYIVNTGSSPVTGKVKISSYYNN